MIRLHVDAPRIAVSIEIEDAAQLAVSTLNPIASGIRYAYAEAAVGAPFATVALLGRAYLQALISAPVASATELIAVYDSDNRFLKDRAAVSESHAIDVGKTSQDQYQVDAQIESIGVGKALDHGVSVGDQFNRTIGYGREFAELIAVEEQASAVFSKSLADPLFWSDTNRMFFRKTIVDPIDRIVIDENLSFELAKQFTQKAVFSEQFDRVVTYNRNFTDSAFFTDDIDGEASVDDDQTMHFTKRNLVGNDFQATDVFSRTVDFHRSLTDSASLSEEHRLSLEKTRQDALRVDEQHDLSVGKSLGDAASLSEQIESIDVGKTLDQEVAFHESAELGVSKPLADSGAVSESLTTQVSKQLTDAIDLSLTTNYRITKKLLSPIHENRFYASESHEIGLTKPASDAFTITESSTNQVTKAPSDSVSVADAGSLVSQGYVDTNDYFLETYVGTSRSF